MQTQTAIYRTCMVWEVTSASRCASPISDQVIRRFSHMSFRLRLPSVPSLRNRQASCMQPPTAPSQSGPFSSRSPKPTQHGDAASITNVSRRKVSSGATSASRPAADFTAGGGPPVQPHPTRPRHAPATLSQVLGRDPKATPEMLVLMGALQTAGKVIASKARRGWAASACD